MKHKLLVILAVLSVLLVSSGTALAQGTTPPVTSDSTTILHKGMFMSREEKGQNLQVVSPPAALAVTPTLANPDFEQGRFVGWSESDTYGYPLVINFPELPPQSGGWVAWLGGDDSETSIISQSFVEIINPTHLRLWYWIASADTGCGYDFGSVMINSNPIHTWNLCPATETYGWVPLDLDLSAYAGQTVTVSIKATTDTRPGTWSNLFIDNLSLYGTFADVPYSHMFVQQIEGFYNAGLTTGCTPAGQTPKMYCPYNNVTRAEMAVFLERAMGNFTPSPNPTGMFADVPGTFWASKFIDEYYNDGITTGCAAGPLRYCPDNNVTRQEMAVFIERALGNFNPSPSPSGNFADVPYPGMPSTFPAFIDQFYNDGITTGCAAGPLRFCPLNNVTRQEMAVFIVRAFHIPLP